MNLITIDPGVKVCALGAFVNRSLIAVTSTLAWTWGPLQQHTEIVCEAMRIYPNEIQSSTPQKLIAKANDLLNVQRAGARLVGQIEAACVSSHSTHFPTAREWKGQIKKPVHHGQILRALTVPELAILLVLKPDLLDHVKKACERYARSKSLTGYAHPIHNALDAVGIGLKHLKRIQ